MEIGPGYVLRPAASILKLGAALYAAGHRLLIQTLKAEALTAFQHKLDGICRWKETWVEERLEEIAEVVRLVHERTPDTDSWLWDAFTARVFWHKKKLVVPSAG